MGRRAAVSREPSETRKRHRPATTPEDREDQLIAMAYNAVEERIMNGTASSQELVHFLRLGSTKERIEKEILERQKDLITAKTDMLQSAKKVEEMYENAIRAMSLYAGENQNESDIP